MAAAGNELFAGAASTAPEVVLKLMTCVIAAGGGVSAEGNDNVSEAPALIVDAAEDPLHAPLASAAVNTISVWFKAPKLLITPEISIGANCANGIW